MAKQKELMVKVVIDGVEIRHIKISTMAKNYVKVRKAIDNISAVEFIDFEVGYLLTRDFMGALDSLIKAVKDIEKGVNVTDLQKMIHILEDEEDAI